MSDAASEAEALAWLNGLATVQGWVGRLPFNWKKLRLEFRPDQLIKVRTDDGAGIALGRYLPRGRRRFAEPVVLCHGLGANRFTFDFDERYSLARRLAEHGFEAWILELRGREASGKARESSFDHQVEYDVTSALRTVLGTGAKSVLWVGHSKGGLLAMGHIGRNPAAPIRAIAALGSPATFTVQKGLKSFARLVRPLVAGASVPIQNLARLAAIVPPPAWFMRYLAHPENLEDHVRQRALVNVGANVAGGVGRQFLRWISTGRWTSMDDRFDYERGLAAVRVPTMLIAGTRDLLAPPESVAHAAKFLGGSTTILSAGKDHGLVADYGHGDLMLGRHAPEELYPRVIEFLEAHATPG